jgi:cytosine/adenosine deaminase-related metal-dependent hydrolase
VVPAHDKPPISSGAVAIADDRIEAIGPFAELLKRFPDADRIGGSKYLLIPGLINAHGHGRGLSSFQRGACDDTLEPWIWETRKSPPLPVYDDVILSACRLLKSGVTATMHNHVLSDPVNYQDEFDQSLRAYRDTGLRVFFCPSIRNQNPFIYGDNEQFLSSLPQELKSFLTASPPSNALNDESYIATIEDLHASHSGNNCRIGFGPLAPQWCTKNLLSSIFARAAELGAPVHIHALESVLQKIYGISVSGKSLIRSMLEYGILGQNTVIAHGVWATAADIDILAETDTAVSHQPSSNLRLRAGVAPVWPMLEAGVRVGLGLDGCSINDDDDIIQEMKVCFLLHRLNSLELESPYPEARDIFKMVTETNSRLIGFETILGRLESGRQADMVLLDYEQMSHPYTDPGHDPIETLLYRGCGCHVRMVMIAGRVIVENGRVLTVDEDAVAVRLAERLSQPLTEKEKETVKMIDALQKYIRLYYRDYPGRVILKPFYSPNSQIDGLK